MRCVAATALAAVLFGASVFAQTPVCDALGKREHATAEKILDSEYLYDCCDETIGRCLKAQPTCALAVRLADNVCRRIAAGQDAADIRRALSRRARSMVGGGAPVEMDLGTAPAVGRADAPVTLVVYACARCPYCSRLIPRLHQEITGGTLKDHVRLVFRVFPIRGHEGSTEAGLGFAAAAAMGGFWPYMLYSYEHFDAFSADSQEVWATASGLDGASFAAGLADPATREVLVASKKEGLMNGVEQTPTFFINGRRWVGDLELGELADAIEEESERIRGKQWTTD